MFPEFRELISKLKTTDHHFSRLFDKHNGIDEEIQKLETKIPAGTHVEIENLKKEKLLLKDQLYAILTKHEEV